MSNDLAKRVAEVIGLAAPQPNPTFNHDNTTAFITIFGKELLQTKGLIVGVLATVDVDASLQQAALLKQTFGAEGINVLVVGEILKAGVDQTYSAADATGFDGVIVPTGAEGLFDAGNSSSTFFPAARPLQILGDAYRWGKPVGALGSAIQVLRNKAVGITTTAGVYEDDGSGTDGFAASFVEGLKTFRFVDRFPVDA